MKKINANFTSKDYSKKYGITVAIRRGSCVKGVETGDPKALPLLQNESSHDDIIVKVYDGSLLNVIAMCYAHVSEVTPSAIPFREGTVYSEVRQASAAYGAQQLNIKKSSFTQYDAPTMRILTIETIEVNENNRRQGVATSIVDYLNTLIHPEIIIGFALPYFTPQVSTNTASPATTNIVELDKLMQALKFKHNGKVAFVGAGTPIEVEMYQYSV